jgi:polyisoprenoid-binding protein YceI
MKKVIFLSAVMLINSGLVATAQKTTHSKPLAAADVPAVWNVDPVHTTVKFSVTHLTVSQVEGTFKMFSGSVAAPTKDFNNAAINFTVDVNSLNTDNDMRDKHLKSDDFFNAEKFPKMTFTSTSFKKVSGSNYTLEGNLTIRDVTKKVKFAVVYGGTATDPYKNVKAGFRATGKISRKAYNLKWSALTEAGGAVVGDEVTMNLNVELAQQKS